MLDFREFNNALWGTNCIPSSIKVTYILSNLKQRGNTDSKIV
jgi:hypothetical protein